MGVLRSLNGAVRVALKLTLGLTGLMALCAPQAWAYPSKPINMVVPYAPGGSTDVLARILAEAMARDLGQAVVVENVGGAGGTIGTAKVTRATPDGHTVLLHNMGVAIAPALYKKLSFDVTRDLEPVALSGDVPMIMVRQPRFAPASVAELIQFMKAHPGDVKVAHAGIGSTSHVCALLFAQATGTQATLVPYRGTGPALSDLLAGNVDLTCDQPVSTHSYLQAGSLKPYAVATKERLAILPTVPTFAESGLPSFKLSVWHGLYAPKGTPNAVIERLNQSVRAALAQPAVIKRLSDMGIVIPQGERLTPAALNQHTLDEVRNWTQVLGAAGLQLD
jgi:tripartite-type tricarboxylate transporter receptor subunit TctC